MSSQYDEIRGERQAHVENVRANVDNVRTNVDIADLENAHDERVSGKQPMTRCSRRKRARLSGSRSDRSTVTATVRSSMGSAQR